MTLRDCITTAVAGGEMEPERAARAASLFDQLDAGLRGRMNRDQAAREAARQTQEVLAREAAEKRRRTLLQVVATRRALADVFQYTNAKGEIDPSRGLLALLDRDERAAFSNVAARREAVRGRLHSRMVEVLATFKRDLIGRPRQRATLDNLVREAFGTDTGDAAARELARAWGEAAEYARRRFNAAGGHTAKRADWGMPQHHDVLKVRRASFQEWRDFIAPRLDPARMADEATGLPHTPETLELALRQVYETLRTDGFNKMTPGLNGGAGVPAGRALAGRRADPRFLVFRDADSWLQYQDRFGGAEPFSVMMSHLDGMARDIARMEILGPNDRATLQHLAQSVEKWAVGEDAAEAARVGQGGGLKRKAGSRNQDRARRRIKLTQDMFAHLSGGASTPVDGGFARSFAGLRAMLTSAQLGAAAISAITDVNFGRVAAAHVGIPQTGVIRRLAGQLNPANPGDRRLAVRLGLVAEHWSSVAMAHARYVGEIQAPEVAARVSDFVLRASGLSPWTQAGRWAFGMEFLGTLADRADTPFDALPKPMRDTFARYGIGADRWDIIRATELYEHDGAFFLRPEDIAARQDLGAGAGDDLADQVLEMVQAETEFAVPSSSLKGRAALLSDLQPGTLQGELIRSAAMYKTFAVTLATTHMARAIAQRGVKGKVGYGLNLAISATVMGALALQLKEIAKGRDPRPMTSGEFWGAAMLQGGGLGIFGDFLFADLNRFDRGLAETVAGPVVAFANDARRLTLGNLAQLPGEKPTNFGNEVTGFLKRYTPGGSLWYARLAYERLLLDTLQDWTDPQAPRRRRRLERRIRRQTGQGFFWRPGRAAPDRAPDLGNVLESRP